MGWSSANPIFDGVAMELQAQFGKKKMDEQIAVLIALAEELQDGDWDTEEESFGITDAGDQALKKMGFHLWVHGSCDWPDDPEVIEKCVGCGYVNPW